MTARRHLPGILIFLSLGLPGLTWGAEPHTIDPAELDPLVRRALRAWDVPGAALVIVHEGKVVYLAGHGVREKGTDKPVTPDTVFPLASCSKAFTTTALALLVDEGKLDWDDPVRKHLPYFKLSDPAADADVRLRDLVTHRTGLRGHDLLWYRSPWSQEEIIRRVGRLPLDHPFRTKFQYQSTMFTAAGHALASAAKMPWEAFIQKRLLDPLEMKATTLTTTAAARSADRSAAHRKSQGRVEVIPWYVLETPDPAGSVNSTARDLAKWLQFHLDEGVVNGKRLVSEKSLRETHTPQIALRLEGVPREMNPETNLMSYGMGWLVQDYRGHLLLSHAGLIDGFRAQLTLLPRENLGIAILSNLHETRMNLALSNSLVDLCLNLPTRDWNRHFARIVAKEQADRQARQRDRQARRQTGTQPSHPPEAYAGLYDHPAYGSARVQEDRGQLALLWSSFRCPLEHFHNDTFAVHNEYLEGALLTFHLDGTGQVASMSIEEALGVSFTKK